MFDIVIEHCNKIALILLTTVVLILVVFHFHPFTVSS